MNAPSLFAVYDEQTGIIFYSSILRSVCAEYISRDPPKIEEEFGRLMVVEYIRADLAPAPLPQEKNNG